MASAEPFGAPGIGPTWSASAKDVVTTALGPSRLWTTVGLGIVNEVYWPSTGEPQIRDLGFIVADDHEWFEVKRVNRYQVTTLRGTGATSASPSRHPISSTDAARHRRMNATK